MNAPSEKTWAYILGAVILCLLILAGWFAFHREPPPTAQPTAKIEVAKPQAHRDTTDFEPEDDSTNEQMATQPENSTTTNAADLYRQAFALYDALSKDERGLMGDWRTNVDASLESELCEKLRPICELMHQAAGVTNCDWGIESITTKTRMTHFQGARNVSRAALWNVVHCRSNDVTGATDDAVGVLRLGRNVSQAGFIGCLVDQVMQGLAALCVADNIGLFSGVNAQRLVAAFNDPAYEDAPGRAMEQKADETDRMAAQVAAMPAAEFSDPDTEWVKLAVGFPTNVNQAATVAAFKQNAELERELAKVLAASSEDAYEAWQQRATELVGSDPLATSMLQTDEKFMDHIRYAEVNRALVVAGLTVAQAGADTLPSHPDPSSGQPFVYTQTADGFELRSTYQTNGKPMTMQFKSR